MKQIGTLYGSHGCAVLLQVGVTILAVAPLKVLYKTYLPMKPASIVIKKTSHTIRCQKIECH